MELEEFLNNGIEEKKPAVEEIVEEDVTPEEDASAALEVQKAVVESLAADKVARDHELEELKKLLEKKDSELAAKAEELASKVNELSAKDAELAAAKAEAERVKAELAAQAMKEIDMQERNPNALALLDRDTELPDRFPGETRDHVIEVIKEARDKAEADGRIRRAQLLESVLVANEPNGNLAKKRAALQKFFNENNNILSGKVIEELTRCGISYKKGEEFLLPSEILTRTY